MNSYLLRVNFRVPFVEPHIRVEAGVDGLQRSFEVDHLFPLHVQCRFQLVDLKTNKKGYLQV